MPTPRCFFSFESTTKKQYLKRCATCFGTGRFPSGWAGFRHKHIVISSIDKFLSKPIATLISSAIKGVESALTMIAERNRSQGRKVEEFVD